MERPTDPLVAAVGDIAPYLRVVRVVALLGTPAEVAVPIVRRLRHQSGVPTAPSLMTLANAVVALAMTYFLPGAARWQGWEDRRIPGARRIGVAYLVFSPTAAVQGERGVIFPGRSPLWAVLISPTTGLLRTLLGLVVSLRAGKAKKSETHGAANDSDQDPASGP